MPSLIILTRLFMKFLKFKYLNTVTIFFQEEEEVVRRRGDDEEGGEGEEQQPVEVPETKIDVEFPKINTNLGNHIHLVKLPNFLSVETR